MEIADSMKSIQEVHELQTQYLMLKMASRKKRRETVRDMIRGKRPINLLIVYPYDKILTIVNELGSINGTSFTIFKADNFNSAITILDKVKADIVILACQSTIKCSVDKEPKNCLRKNIDEFRKLFQKTPFIVCAEKSEHECDLAAIEAGASDFLEGDEINAHRLEKSIRYSLRKTS
jgi:PleD family two-component response regulator